MIDERKQSEDDFFRDITNHAMTVIRDDGVYRHLRFSSNGSSVYRFDLITWPGMLCYTGDMGTFVFQRMEDMFEFFRTDREHSYHLQHGYRLEINPGYWADKLIATNCYGRGKGSAMEFDSDRFKAVVRESLDGWLEDVSLDEDGRSELVEAVENEVLCFTDEHECYTSAYEFNHRDHATGNEFEFSDVFEHNLECFTHSFMWACFAIAWGVEQYDHQKHTEAEE